MCGEGGCAGGVGWWEGNGEEADYLGRVGWEGVVNAWLGWWWMGR